MPITDEVARRERYQTLRTMLEERRLSPVENAALHAALDKPLSVKKLARLAGYRAGSHFSAAVTQLCRMGKLVRVPDGVRRAEEE